MIEKLLKTQLASDFKRKDNRDELMPTANYEKHNNPSVDINYCWKSMDTAIVYHPIKI